MFAGIMIAALVSIQLPEHFQQVMELKHQNFAVNHAVARLAQLRKASRQPMIILFVVIKIGTVITEPVVAAAIAMMIATLATILIRVRLKSAETVLITIATAKRAIFVQRQLPHRNRHSVKWNTDPAGLCGMGDVVRLSVMLVSTFLAALIVHRKDIAGLRF